MNNIFSLQFQFRPLPAPSQHAYHSPHLITNTTLPACKPLTQNLRAKNLATPPSNPHKDTTLSPLKGS